MKRHLSILSLMLLLPFSLIYAQETSCTSESVANSYAAAVAQGTDTQAWYQTNYANSNCSDSIKAYAQSLVTFKYSYQGKDYDIYSVPTQDGVHQWALIKKGRQSSQFIDPANPDAGLIDWVGNFRSLQQVLFPSKLPVIPIADLSLAPPLGIREANFANLPLLNAVLSPKGSTVAGVEDQTLCLYIFFSGKKSCAAIPETFSGQPLALYWSPDNKTIAFNEDYAQKVQESDIWLFDTATGRFSDVTDDGVSGDYVQQAAKPFTLDYEPTWNSVSGDLYFARSLFNADVKQFKTDLYRLSVKTGDASLVTSLDSLASTASMCSIAVPSNYGPALHGTGDISPDGKTLALIIRDDCSYETKTSIWLIDLAGQNPPRLLVDQSQLQTGMPDYWKDIPIIPYAIAWAAGNAGLLVTSGNPQYESRIPSKNAYYVDVATGSVTPIMDFSGGLQEEFLGARGTAYDVPYGFGLSPNGKKLIMLSNASGVTNILTMKLPPDGYIPARVYSSPDFPTHQYTNFSTTSADGKILTDGFLISLNGS